MAGGNDDIALLGYSDRLSLRPGETIEFKLSSKTNEPVKAWLTRSICADPNPDSPGIIEESADAWFPDRSIEACHQPFYPGSYAATENTLTLRESFRFCAIIFPMLEKHSIQTVLSVGDVSLIVDETGAAALHVGGRFYSTDVPLKLRCWYRLEAICEDGTVTVRQTPVVAALAVSAERTGVISELQSEDGLAAVSYTHLTLPTICSV